MKKLLLVAFLAMLGFEAFSQIKFEKGYFIDNKGQRTDCLIKNVDWLNNPSSFKYKNSPSAEVRKASIENIKEFGIINQSKYKRIKVYIDDSGEDFMGSMSIHKKAEFEAKQLFLKTLVEGKASLYKFELQNIRRYFYQVEGEEIKQLIAKKYVPDQVKINRNNRYKQQLFNALKCASISKYEIEKLKYQASALMKLFKKYNECSNAEYIFFKQKKNNFNLWIRPRMNFSTLSIQSEAARIDFDQQIKFRYGLEAELILPFNKNKWSIFTEPTYQHFKANTIGDVEGRLLIEGGVLFEDKIITGVIRKLKVNVDFKSLEIPIGVRYHVFFNEKSKLFFNGAFIFDLMMSADKGVIVENDDTHFLIGEQVEISSTPFFNLGIGYAYQDKFHLELRYQPKRSVENDFPRGIWDIYQESYALVLGYNLF